MINFAVVKRLELLEGYLHGEGRVVEAVAREISLSTGHVPQLGTIDLHSWFGSPIRIENENDQVAIENTRVGRFGGTKSRPTQHLGESQTLHVIQHFPEHSGSVWITDDGSAYKLGKGQGVLTRHTVDIFQELVVQGEISSHDAYELCEEMQNEGRSLLDPPASHRDFC
ncbi:hypothetical protein ITJ38_15325 [Agreia pratensis]|uniref:hypothetical protein n=1 Tax=Agreia pratensis TaxID=150121 RepID=UPI00188C60D5|nr:hypothetical protein [Agreia pratensis]MBF4635784.1 hypothetical protein [Agreia pratensis]